jgi:hypothetical protein
MAECCLHSEELRPSSVTGISGSIAAIVAFINAVAALLIAYSSFPAGSELDLVAFTNLWKKASYQTYWMIGYCFAKPVSSLI